MPRLPLTGMLWAAVTLQAFDVPACERGTVRDAAFAKPRDVHRMCVFTSDADEEGAQIQESLESWLQGPGNGLNVRIERVNANSPSIDWTVYGIPSAPPRLPAVALIGESVPSGKPFVVTAWEPAPALEELDALAASVACTQICDALGKYWAVILHAPGNTPGVHDALERVQERWAKEQAPGLAVVILSGDSPAERVLRAFVGVPKDGSDWVGVVFGKGKLLAPPLVGARIGNESLNGLLESLAVQCTCLHESVRLGLDLPMKWDETITQAALALSAGNPSIATSSRIATAGLGGGNRPAPWRFYLVLGLGVLCAAGTAILVTWMRQPKA